MRRGPGRAGRFVRGLAVVFGTVAAVAALTAGSLAFLLHRHSHPPRATGAETPGALFAAYEDARFTASDGVPLAGWWMRGAAGAPVIILCHDLGESRSSLLGLASLLSQAGYGVFLFDFRGHGESGGSSSFGTLEKRDLLAAIDRVIALGKGQRVRLGVLGIGMGAHAAVLAAAERPEVVCLVLDSPYRSVSSSFARARLGGESLARWLMPPASMLYRLFYGVRPDEETAERGLPQLTDRDVLLLAATGDEPVAEDVRALYDALPEARHHDKNLILLAATRTTPLYDEDRARYDQVALTFFRSYLPVAPAVAEPAATPRRTSRP